MRHSIWLLVALMGCDAGDTDNPSVSGDGGGVPFQADTWQGSGDGYDMDSDADGVSDATDNCPFAANPDQADNEGDGNGDVCDLDDDNDGVPDLDDNCTLIANPNQKDTDLDDWGNVCDNCPANHNPNQSDLDGDGIGDACTIVDVECPTQGIVVAEGVEVIPQTVLHLSGDQAFQALGPGATW